MADTNTQQNGTPKGVVAVGASAGGVGGAHPVCGGSAVLAQLGGREIEPYPGMELENTIALGPRVFTEFDTEVLGPPSVYTCPDCNGSLLAVSEKNFRCRVGHTWSSESLLAARDNEVDGALWVALRSLHEKAKLSRRLAEDSCTSPMAQRYHELADEAEHAISVLDRRLAAAGPDSGQPGDE